MSDKDLLATEITKKYALYSAGAGLIPIPFVDWAAITGVQVKMLADLGALYGVPFEADRVRPVVSALLGGYASQKLGYGIGGSLLKSIPVIGTALGVLSVPAFAGAITFAVGKVFIQHFASGGTFLDFDPDKVRAYFQSEVAKARA
jgi:uncharacterized protein (DUF697 family)